MAHEFHEFTRNRLNYINGDLIGRTNLTNNKSFVFMQRLCLEGTTERSDSNRVRSARIDGTRTMCLEGTTPQDKAKISFHVSHQPHIPYCLAHQA